MKAKTVFFCTECGNETPKWSGRCPACADAEEIKEIKNGALITLRVSGDLENLQALQYTTEHGQGIVLMPLQNNK